MLAPERRIAVLALATFASGTEAYVYTGLLSDVASDLSVDVGRAGLLATGLAVTYAFCAPFLASLTAALPRRRVLTLGLWSLGVVDLAASAAPSFAWLLASRVVCGAIAAFVNPSAGAGGAAAPPPYGARLHRHLFVRRVSRASRQRGCWSARLDVGLFQACIGLGSILRILCDGRLPDRSDAARYLPRLIAVIVCTQLGYVGAQSLSLAVPTASALLATSIRRDADLPDRPVQRCELRRPSRAVHAQAGRRCRAYPTKCRSG